MDEVSVEVAYALPDEQILIDVSVPSGTNVKGVVLKSDVLKLYPHLDIESMQIGIFGKLAKMDYVVRARDRVEIYRPLIADPKEVRRRKAAEGKKLNKGGSTTPKKEG